MADQQAAAVFQYMGLPVPTREKTVKVYIQAKDLQPEVLEGYADMLAATVVTASMCHGVTRIDLHFPGRDVVSIDCDDVKKACAAASGFWPSAPTAPPYVSVYELMKLGAFFEPWRPIVAVPEQVGAPRATHQSDAVSGTTPAATEA